MTEGPHDDETTDAFSDRTRAALVAATEALRAGLADYLDAVRDLPADQPGDERNEVLFPADTAVADALRSWLAAAEEHTDLAPVYLVEEPWERLHDPDEDDEEDDDGPGTPPAVPRRISVVSRYDLAVTDPDALFDAARVARADQAYPPEAMTPEAVRRDGVGSALYDVSHGATPWRGVPGIEFRGGRSVYVAADPDGPDPAAGLDSDDLAPQLLGTLPPAGRVEFTETW